ncbi:response regulator transcription factor [Micrococcales bacterium 31B]|nr:response regulator transcription factor [Micrococcales bacterium 31B]
MESAARILIVDDERDLAALLRTYLERAGYQVTTLHTGPEARGYLRDTACDVVILDLGLPGLDGLEVCRDLRTHSDCYVLMLTARTDEIDRIVGLSVGADDYITKPFSPREVVARVQAVLRRPRNPAPGLDAVTFGALAVNHAARRVTLAGAPVDLTRTEFDILATLTASPHLAFSRRRLIDEVWDTDWVGDEHVVDVHVARIRRKLGDDPAAPTYIDTVRGVGYRMVAS